MRNFESRATHFMNGHFSLQGRAWERSYRSWPRGNAAGVLKSIVYTVMNPVKQRAVRRAEDYEFNDTEVYFEAKANGIVTHVPAMWSALGKTAEERAREVKKLIEEVWRDAMKHGMKKGDLLNAARRAIALRPALRDGRRWAETLPVGAWVGHDEAEKKRKEVLDRERPFVEFQPRRAPAIGNVIEIRVKRVAPRPLAGARWRDWHA